MEKHFITLAHTEIGALISKKFNETDLKIYLYICSKMTFVHGLFGIFSNHTVYSIQKALEYDEKNTVKRSLEKLQKHKLLYVISKNKALIISKTNQTLAQVQDIIENFCVDFNLSEERLSELEKLLSIKFNRGKIYAKIEEEKKIQEKLKSVDSSKITRSTKDIVDIDQDLSDKYEELFGKPEAPGRANQT